MTWNIKSVSAKNNLLIKKHTSFFSKCKKEKHIKMAEGINMEVNRLELNNAIHSHNDNTYTDIGNV